MEQPRNDIHLAVGDFTNLELNEDGSNRVDKDGKYDITVYWRLLIEIWVWMRLLQLIPYFFFVIATSIACFGYGKKNGATKILTTYQETGDITGINTTGQDPMQYQIRDQQLAIDTILYPFKSDSGEPRTNKDCINIHELGYNYSKGSLDDSDVPPSFPNCQTCSHVNSLQ